jgi:dihydroflavonol-4-reductase
MISKVRGMSRVLVTGGSGFVGVHCILQLLEMGESVCTTLRSKKRRADVLAMLKEGGVEPGDRLTFVKADLERDEGWSNAAAGCDYALHVASPFPSGALQDENDLIGPARDGALRVLRACRNAGVKRAVVTSSFAAVGYGHKPREQPFDESSWTDLGGADAQPYIKSKTLAERAAWDFIASDGGALELAVVNPVGIFGPTLGSDLSSSIGIIKALMDGAMPAAPRIFFGVVDVRDVADLHIRVMTAPEAKGERFLAVAGHAMSLHDVAMVLRRRLGASARRAPRFEMPDWLTRAAALANPRLRPVLPQLGMIRNATAEKARRMLGWTPRSNEEAIIATAASLVRLGLLKTQH